MSAQLWAIFLAVISYQTHAGPATRQQCTKLLSWLKFFSLNMLNCPFLNYSKNTKPGEPRGYHHKCRLNPVMSLAVAHHDRLAKNGDQFLWIIILWVSHEIINGYTCGPMFYSAKSVKWSCNQFTLSLVAPTSFVHLIWKANLRWHLSGVSLFRIYRGRQRSYVWCREFCWTGY